MKISVVLVTYNRLPLLKEAVDAVLDLKKNLPEDVQLDLYVIDNASTDGTASYLVPLAKDSVIHLVHSSKNLGGAGGFNLGMKEAMKNNPDYVWLMDDDTIVQSDSLNPLLEQMKAHPHASFFSSRALWTDGTDNKMNEQRLMEKNVGQPAVRCREATFVSLMVNADAIRKYGLPIKEFFIWGDDIEYTRRLSSRMESYYVPGSVVLHKTATNSGSNIVIDSKERIPRYRYAYRNEVFIAKEEGTFRKLRQMAKILYHSGNVLLKSKEDKKEKLQVIWSASKEGLDFDPKIEYIETEPEAKAPVRVLEVFREPIANGGQESFIMNMYRTMDHDKIQMDFLTPFTCDNEKLKNEIEQAGGRVFAGGYEFGKDDNKAFVTVLTDFLKEHTEYRIIHFHSGSTFALMKGPQIAAEAGIPVRIVHSHCGGFDNLKYRIVKAISTPYFHKYTTDFAACSNLAAAWKFPADVIEAKQYTIFKNAVDLDRFNYSEQTRNRVRQENGVDRQIVLGHVGRFSQQKNHPFLIEIFDAFHQKHHNSVLWLIGTGEDFDAIKQLVKEKGLEKSVRFFGLRSDIPDLMNGMDAFVLPSFFEGLPVVGVEAQACSLPVIASDQVTKELPLTELSAYLPLDQEKMNEWVSQIEKMVNMERKDRREEMIEAGYEVKSAAKRMQNFYLRKLEDQR